ncbi:unnamed protein product [Trichobilharzia regenti]|nr:unnamed protein product [Trichobilharzia regenti]
MASDNPEMNYSWIEVTPHSLDYSPNGDFQAFGNKAQTPGFSEPSGLHTIIEERLLNRFLTEAQEHSGRTSDASPPSPPLSYDGLNTGELSEQIRSPQQITNAPKVLINPAQMKPYDEFPMETGDKSLQPDQLLLPEDSQDSDEFKEFIKTISPNSKLWKAKATSIVYVRLSEMLDDLFVCWNET